MKKKSNVIPFPSAAERLAKEMDKQERELREEEIYFHSDQIEGGVYCITWTNTEDEFYVEPPLETIGEYWKLREQPEFKVFLDKTREDAERIDALNKAIDKRLDKFIAECEREDND